MKKKFILDIFINLIATSLPLTVLQLISMPVIARYENAEEYGNIILLISILTLISFPIGNSLNNIRLLKNNDLKNKYLKGNFQYLLFKFCIYGVIGYLFTVIIFTRELGIKSIIFQIIILILLLLKDYWVVEFRIDLNYKKIFFNNFILSLGYLVGTGVYVFLGAWEIIYLTGLISSFVFLIKNTSIYKEPLTKTFYYKEVNKDFSLLYIASLLTNTLNYADKIILYPLLGPEKVAIYFSATIVGKLISMIFGPINSVILSYIVKVEKFSLKIFSKGLLVSFSVLSLGYFITIYISPYILLRLYPTWADESIIIINITTLAIYVSILSSIFQPFNLRYNNIKWQIYISSSSILIFVSLSTYLALNYDLVGYAVALLITNIYILLFQILLFVKNK